jgi:SAM-dependent methyltransferase
MSGQGLLREISDYCRAAGIAESTFGRRAVNDGKFVSRLREGGAVTAQTLERVRRFIRQQTPGGGVAAASARERQPMSTADLAPAAARKGAPAGPIDPEQNFRFYDNRQKYLMFVNTCSEKWVVAHRVVDELKLVQPHPPAFRLFDAGVGDGTVLTRVMRTMHSRFDKMPFYIVGKEISLEDVRLALEKMPDRFFEHPAMVLIMTNMHYAEAPWLQPSSLQAANAMVWHEVALRGNTAAEFDEQIAELQPFLAEAWQAGVSKKTGNPIYQKPAVLVLYREDCRFILDSVLPRRGAIRADYDLVIASQPYRARASTEFKARRVIAPLARSLAPGGRLLGIHSYGRDPALEIIQKVWPGEEPFHTDRHALLAATKAALGKAARSFNFVTGSDSKAIFRYDMHTLPGEIDSDSASIGTSTLFAAWNDAAYVAQIEDQRLEGAMKDDGYLQATREVLRKHNGLWFNDESYVITRKRDLI